MKTYRKLAEELQHIAMGKGFDAEVLSQAQDKHGTTLEEKAMLQRWIVGADTDADFFELQEFANKLYLIDKRMRSRNL